VLEQGPNSIGLAQPDKRHRSIGLALGEMLSHILGDQRAVQTEPPPTHRSSWLRRWPPDGIRRLRARDRPAGDLEATGHAVPWPHTGRMQSRQLHIEHPDVTASTTPETLCRRGARPNLDPTTSAGLVVALLHGKFE